MHFLQNVGPRAATPRSRGRHVVDRISGIATRPSGRPGIDRDARLVNRAGSQTGPGAQQGAGVLGFDAAPQQRRSALSHTDTPLPVIVRGFRAARNAPPPVDRTPAFLQQAADDLRLPVAKERLAIAGENLGDGHVRGALDLGIRIEERDPAAAASALPTAVFPAPIMPTITTVFFNLAHRLRKATFWHSLAQSSDVFRMLNDVILSKRPVITWD